MNVKKVFTLIFSFFFVFQMIFAQTSQNSTSASSAVPSIEMPSMPDMPQMPSLSASGSFYTPSFPSRARKNDSVEKTDADSEQNETVLKQTSSENLVSSLLGQASGLSSSTLKAADISALYDSGLFDSLYSTGNSSIQNYSANYTSNLLLQQILQELGELKNQQKNATAAEKQQLSDIQSDSKNFRKNEAAVLRFKINGYDIVPSLTSFFFSRTEDDGTFLFTADRKYFANGRTYSETFYMLFSPENLKGSVISYSVQPSIVQENKNENSYVYKLMCKKNLKAEKTGNLVVLHFDDEKINADILLDIAN